ncbi:MAG: shikimate kinase [Myxococcota bacterium]
MTLLGLAGVGKSTVGRLLAARWGWTFRDLDADVEARAGRTIPELFDEEGEAGFRAREAEALADALGRDRLVLAPGGGAPCQPDAMDRILAAGPAVWLRASPEILADRLLEVGDRPLVAGLDRAGTMEAIEQQLSERAPHYRRATCAVDVDDLTPAAAADAVEEALAAQGVAP